jgi:hypothetical protein
MCHLTWTIKITRQNLLVKYEILYDILKLLMNYINMNLNVSIKKERKFYINTGINTFIFRH